MVSGFLFNARVEIVRRAAATAGPAPTTYDSWNVAAYGADEVVATVPGRIRPLSIEEQPTLSEAGPTAATAEGFFPSGTDIQAGDRLRRTTGETYEVRGVPDSPGGRTDYVLVELARVTP